MTLLERLVVDALMDVGEVIVVVMVVPVVVVFVVVPVVVVFVEVRVMLLVLILRHLFFDPPGQRAGAHAVVSGELDQIPGLRQRRLAPVRREAGAGTTVTAVVMMMLAVLVPVVVLAAIVPMVVLVVIAVVVAVVVAVEAASVAIVAVVEVVVVIEVLVVVVQAQLLHADMAAVHALFGGELSFLLILRAFRPQYSS
jgi:hypothetical protein